MSTKASNLQQAINNLLNVLERAELHDILESYQHTRNVRVFTRSLDRMLNTPAKRELVGAMRSVIPTRDVRLFDQLTSGRTTRSGVDDWSKTKKDIDAMNNKSRQTIYCETVPAKRANKVSIYCCTSIYKYECTYTHKSLYMRLHLDDEDNVIHYKYKCSCFQQRTIKKVLSAEYTQTYITHPSDRSIAAQ